ncbi:CubicO group peptidase (beta-lactamase class C family) [Tahibacter aquaticus]|uniref:CubicO group peptidase (Beta-lactamase class C family) n=1 Tax=Tahibacter aquaticus TaxID=520092 RepID=A0A4R6YSV7_9GAMM|nr:serine hydrolase domain-containing protein [Tahibacter aquaticus]TDR41172.1 CubicO group peptidase (beta-lactamase class C family) [Tahibacter aquaticus]
MRVRTVVMVALAGAALVVGATRGFGLFGRQGSAMPDMSRTSLSAAQMASIDRYISGEMARQRIPGLALGIYRHGSAVLTKGYGLANIELTVPVSADTVMQSGSIGKSFTATAVMMLVEQGKVGLHDSIRTYFPEAPASWQPITVAHLLSHTSGLAAHDSEERIAAGGPFDLRRDYSEDELVAAMAELPIDFAAGSDWAYQNTNYVLLGVLIHRVTGQFFGDYLQQNIFAPLGMRATRVISDLDIVPHRAAGYEITGGVLRNQQWVSPTFNATADGTLYFTVRDLEHWDRALYGSALLKPATLQQMWTPFPLDTGVPNAEGYGFGWFVQQVNGHRVVEHDGAWQGFTSMLARYLDDGLTVVVLTNLDSQHSWPNGIARVVAGMVEPALMPAPRQVIADDRPPLTQALWNRLRPLMAGDAVTVAADGTGYAPSAETLLGLRHALPPAWDQSPPQLLARQVGADGTESTYRIGQPGNTRLLVAVTTPDGRVVDVAINPDPDNR